MRDAETIMRLDAAAFKRLLGVEKKTFEKMTEILESAYKRLHRAGGSPPRLDVRDKLWITLQYFREYRTMEHIALDWGVAKSTVFESVRWVENTLVKDGTFSLPGKKALSGPGSGVEAILVDVTESPVQRPKKSSAATIRGRKSGTR